MWSKSFRFIKRRTRQPRKSLTQNIKRRSIAEFGAESLCDEFCSDNAHDNQAAVLDGHKTRISLEGPLWAHIRRMAAATDMHVGDFVYTIDRARPGASLSSSCRLAVLADLEKAVRA